MPTNETKSNGLDEILQLIDLVDKKDLENNEKLNSIIGVPYSSGKRPEYEKWEDKGVQFKHM